MPLDSADPSSWLTLHRTVRFGDTDAAGVMHFHQLLRWCHEAYEESLERFGIPAFEVFPSPRAILKVALPIVHCHADFHRPLICGDILTIQLQPHRIDAGRFEVGFQFMKSSSTAPGETMARGLTRHQAIEVTNRKRCTLPPSIGRWLAASENAQEDFIASVQMSHDTFSPAVGHYDEPDRRGCL
jgi:1,4-dihydroxy-2-naphthoyl-CoA hydrolase